jgi:hypothetical protein
VNPLFAAALEIQNFSATHGWRSCVIGGLAVQRWGEPRLTRDVDCTILTGFGEESGYVDALLATFAGRLENTREFALTTRVLLISGSAGIPIDVSLGALPYESRLMDRASTWRVGDAGTLTTCSAEDLVVLKAFAGRDRDWADVEGILTRQAGRLDDVLVWEEFEALQELREDADSAPADKLRRLFRQSRQ